MKKSLLEAAQRIVIEGPIGAGKTSLAKLLCEHLGARAVLEQSETNVFLSRFYQDKSRYALQTQLSFLFQRLEQLPEMQTSDLFPQPVISDYLLEKDLLFAELTLPEDEYKLYRTVYDRLAPTSPPPPDLVIYLQADAPTLITRVHARGVEIERKISDDYLVLLSEAYTRFFHHYSAAPVMIVNSENLNFVDNPADFQLLVQRIEAMRGHREYFNRGE